tara:strand:- start:193 stop:1773 length:1581 start_codon:yes stop_codon:yes gene_type:complete
MGGSGSNAKFYFDGTDLSLSGSINATAGRIGGNDGWEITDKTITALSASLDSREGLVISGSVGNSEGIILKAGAFEKDIGTAHGGSTVGSYAGFDLFTTTVMGMVTSSHGVADMNFNVDLGTNSTGDGSNLNAASNDDFYEQEFEVFTECFIAGTKVWMEDGTEKNIEDIEVGDVVLSYNRNNKSLTNETVTNLVTQEHLKEEDDLTVQLWFDNGTFVHATIANPFIVEGKGVAAWDPDRGNRVHSWVGENFSQLEIGDTILFYDGNDLIKTKLEKAEVYYEQIRTYDIEVENTKTFFANGVLTHNTSMVQSYGRGGTIKGTVVTTGTGDSLRGQESSGWYNTTGDVVAGGLFYSIGSAAANSDHQSIGVFASASNAGGSQARAFGFASPNDVTFGRVFASYRAGIQGGSYDDNPPYSFDLDPDTGMYWATSNTIGFTTGGVGRIRINSTGLHPETTATYNLGTASLRWDNIYTTDLQLSNMDKKEGNKVDGTKGDWTLQEGEDNLFVINNLSGKKYRIALIPEED